MDIRKFDNIQPKEETSGEASESQGADLSAKASILQAGLENEDIVQDASATRPISPTLAKILEGNPVMEATLMPEVHLQSGVPFDENVNVRTELPNGSAVDPGLSSFNIAGRDLSAGPNHFGIDLSKGGISGRDLIAQVLGIINQSAAAPSGGIPAPPGMALYAGGFSDFVNGVKDWVKSLFTADGAIGTATDIALEKFGPPGAGEAMQLLNAPDAVGKATGDPTNFLRGVDGAAHKDSRVQNLWDKQQEESGGNYVNPDGGATPDIFLTPEQAMKIIDLLQNINVRPENSNSENPVITADDVKGATPLDPFTKNPGLRFVADRNPDLQESANVLSEEQLNARLSATGGDPVNPNDEIAPPPTPTDLPDGPVKGGTNT